MAESCKCGNVDLLIETVFWFWEMHFPATAVKKQVFSSASTFVGPAGGDSLLSSGFLNMSLSLALKK